MINDYIKRIQSYTRLTIDEEMTIYYQLFLGNRADHLINRLIESHLPLALRIARQYTNRGIPFEDLLSTAVAEVVRIAHVYTPGIIHRHRFGTLLPSRIKKSLIKVFITTKKYYDNKIPLNLDNYDWYIPDTELHYIVELALRPEFNAEELQALKCRWEFGHTLIEVQRLMGRSRTWVRTREIKAKQIIKDIMY